MGSVASGPRRIDQIAAARPHAEDVRAHRLGAACDLVGGLPLCTQGDEKAADLAGGCLAAHDRVDDLTRLGPRQVVSVQQLRDRVLDHRSSRKFRASSGPTGVRIDSGWNWTPCTGSSR